MSNIKRLFKPKINRVITGLAIVVIIVVGSYLAYKNGVFASTPASGCNITATITRPANFLGQHPIYALDETNYNNVVQHQGTGITIGAKFQLDNGGKTNWTDSGKLYFVIHDGAGKIYTNNTPLSCSSPQTVTLNGYTSQSSASVSFTSSGSNGGTNTETKCIEYPQGSNKYATFTYEGAVWQNLANTDQFFNPGDLGNYTQDESGAKCSGGSDSGPATGGSTGTVHPYCITNYDTAGAFKGTYTSSDNSTYNMTQKISGSPPPTLTNNAISGNTSKQDGACSQTGQTVPTGNAAAAVAPNSQTVPTGLAAATQPVPGCATGYNCYSVGGSGTDKIGCYKDNEATMSASYIPVSSSLCTHQETTPPVTAATGTPTWKCLVRTPLMPQWYYLNQNNKWESQDHSQTINSLTESGVGTGVCTTAQPTTVPTNAILSPHAISDAALYQDPNVPVSGTQAAAVQYPNKINFTAYRVSYAETGQIVPMGGVNFRVKGQSSSKLAGGMVSINGLQATSSNTAILPHDEAKCSTITDIANKFGLSGIYNNTFTTSDNGSTAMYTQAINVAPGYYEVTYSKNTGFGDTTNQKICFQIGTNDGVSTPININVLLDAQPGAEPPGIMNSSSNGKVGGLWVEDNSKGQKEYKTKINNIIYKYMSDFPWYGWQKNESYITGAPVGTTSTGLPVPGVSADYGTTANLQQYLSQCQNYGITLGTTISKDKLPWAGGLIGLATGLLNGKSSLGSLGGRTLAGILAGLGLGAIGGESGVNVSVNVGQLNAQCQALYNNAIPPQCQQCFINGVYNASTCPYTCVQQIPQIQGLLQGNSSVFHF